MKTGKGCAISLFNPTKSALKVLPSSSRISNFKIAKEKPDRNVVIDQVYATGRFVHEKENAGQPLLSNIKPRFPSLKRMLLSLKNN